MHITHRGFNVAMPHHLLRFGQVLLKYGRATYS
jgi:hypothetical protein